LKHKKLWEQNQITNNSSKQLDGGPSEENSFPKLPLRRAFFYRITGVSKGVSQEFLAKTGACWKGKYPALLTSEDLQEITTNTVDFFTVLAEWEHRANNPPHEDSSAREGTTE
jgi:hypothetical protein